MTQYFRAIPQIGQSRPTHSLAIAGGWTWFTEVEVIERGRTPQIVPLTEISSDILDTISAPRADIAGLSMSDPQIMGILNVTPDSFSDGGRYNSVNVGVSHAKHLAETGATIIDIGGESTRPGAETVSLADEIERTAPVIEKLADLGTPISIDTRKAPVARAALDAGAAILNDVAAMTYDPEMADVAASSRAPICLMHAQGDPETMQNDPNYDDVVLDVYDFLAERFAAAEAAGVAPSALISDPGIGFGKTLEHNLALLSRLSLFHSLGAPILLGASRKRFIGVITDTQQAADRVTGSVAVAQHGLLQGVQITRVHDTLETKQAFDLVRAITSVG